MPDEIISELLLSGVLHGRETIYTSEEVVNKENLIDVLTYAQGVHEMNAAEIDYLFNYYRGIQPILSKRKEIRPEINNKVVENHAQEIADFVSGYFLGEPITYVRRGDTEYLGKDIDTLNDMMMFCNKAAHDEELASWLSICGVGYRMVLPNTDYRPGDNSPFDIDIIDPRLCFVVYNTGFGKKPVLSVQIVVEKNAQGGFVERYCCYTPTEYYEVLEGVIVEDSYRTHNLGGLPIFEYSLNIAKEGAFEPVIPILDAINQVTSGRLDGLEQFVQSFLKFKNVEVDDDQVKALGKFGAISFKTSQGLDGDVGLVSVELNQEQTQCLVDYLYDKALVICGMPTTTKGGKSTSDTGSAVILRDGWQQAESRARKTELRFKKSERNFIERVLHICSERSAGLNLKLKEVECKFTRRQHDNLQSKTQALLAMLEAGLSPEVAIAACGLFNDPTDVAIQSKEYLKKWEYVDMTTPQKTIVEEEV